MLTLAEREEIALANARGEGGRAIARLIDRYQSVIIRELRRNTSKRGYRTTTARTRPQQRRMETAPVLRQRVLHDLGRGRPGGPQSEAHSEVETAEHGKGPERTKTPGPNGWECVLTWGFVW